MKPNTFKIVELFLDDLNPFSGVDVVSLVTAPAIEIDFFHFGKEYITDFSKIDEEKRMVVGPALIPNKMILRKDKDGNPFYVYFGEETIRKTAQNFQIKGNQSNSNLEHTVKLEGIHVTETWIIDDPKQDKSTLYGFDLPKGTWMLMSIIKDDAVWEMIKDGTIKGYSVEGSYTDQIQKFEALEQKEDVYQEEDIFEGIEGTEEEMELYKQLIELFESLDMEEEDESTTL